MIHTSSAYRMLSSKASKMDNSKMLRDQSGQDSQRILASSDVQYQFGDSNITVSTLNSCCIKFCFTLYLGRTIWIWERAIGIYNLIAWIAESPLLGSEA